ncbi:Growth arrest and DNA-damage-inducible proteins-interacting protein 1 [Nesidiocoris tenuis]|uniref:Large ribosomal subunit protein mL64 n=1 Tax=Nesidiocoris tenuis TaxID=355587 RepID=A0ABN7A796_9HEMI|nr:Growth arrest and DNA-damage-inducible proteins-interacting protein 1 [Nesidiocoris tenuis]
MALLNRFRGLILSPSLLQRVNYRNASTETKSVTEEIYGTMADTDQDEVMLEREAIIEVKRDKSRLNPEHRNMLHKRLPYDEPKNEFHLTLTHKKRMFGRYGRSPNLDLDLGHLWPTEEEIATKLEYDRIANPYGVLELAARERAKIDEKAKAIDERQKKIVENMKKLERWKADVKQRASKKLADVQAAQAKKEALIEEVRRHFGFKIDPKDERFKEVLQQKEKALKKKAKEEKAKLRQEKLIAEMTKKSES